MDSSPGPLVLPSTFKINMHFDYLATIHFHIVSHCVVQSFVARSLLRKGYYLAPWALPAKIVPFLVYNMHSPVDKRIGGRQIIDGISTNGSSCRC